MKTSTYLTKLKRILDKIFSSKYFYVFRIALIIVSIYLIIASIAPEVSYRIFEPPKEEVLIKKLENDSLLKEGEIPNLYTVSRALVIPKIGVADFIYEGDYKSLNNGFWHRPNTGNPLAGGNTVITGHRFLYTGGSKTLYHLDKVVNGDTLKVYWDGFLYSYEVFDIDEVTPDQIEVEANTEEDILTVYTCTPLWTATHRLVVKARLTNKEKLAT